jgi:hypothetical protein
MLEPKDVDDATMAFPAQVVGTYLPKEEDIPEEFWNRGNEWTEIVDHWFAFGLNHEVSFHAKEGVDGEKAFRHCAAVMKSYEPKHEHKVAGVGYLLSEFFNKIENWRPGEEAIKSVLEGKGALEEKCHE